MVRDDTEELVHHVPEELGLGLKEYCVLFKQLQQGDRGCKDMDVPKIATWQNRPWVAR